MTRCKAVELRMFLLGIFVLFSIPSGQSIVYRSPNVAGVSCSTACQPWLSLNYACVFLDQTGGPLFRNLGLLLTDPQGGSNYYVTGPGCVQAHF